MERNDYERKLRLFNLKRNSKEEVLEWSPTGYGFIAAVAHEETEADSEDYSCEVKHE